MKKIMFLGALLCTMSLVGQELCEDGMAAGQYPCDNVDFWSFMDLDEIGGADNSNDIWGWADPVSGREFAIVGKDNGTAFVEVTDPANPVYLGSLATHSSSSLWRDIKVHNDYAFIVAEAGNHGMQAFDLTQLLSLETIPTDFEETAHFGGFGSAHNIVINEESGRAYGVGTNSFSGGLFIVDIADPLNMTTIGDFSEDGYTHDAHIVNYIGPDKDYCGKEIAFNCNEDEITIVDVTDPMDTEMISSEGYQNAAYTHQGWLTEDHKYFLVNDELDELYDLEDNTKTLIWDVTDLDNPVLIDSYYSTEETIDHNLYVLGNMVIQSNYTSGVRILDCSRVSNGDLNEIGYFDLHPNNNDVGFSGTWSNYAYFPSGNIVATNMYQGFFVLKPRLVTCTYLTEVEEGTTDAIIDVQASTFFSSYNISVSGLPSGVSSDVGLFMMPGNTEVTLTGIESLGVGTYDFSVEVTHEGTTQNFPSQLVVTELPSITGTLPTNEEILSGAGIMFEWNSNGVEGPFSLEIASDGAFSDILFTYDDVTSPYELPLVLVEGSYHWRIVSSDGCGNTYQSGGSNFEVQIVSVNENMLQSLNVYPNPTNGIVTVAGLQAQAFENGVGSFQITDVTGKLVENIAISIDATLQFDLTDYEKGIYLLSVVTSNGTTYRSTLVLE